MSARTVRDYRQMPDEELKELLFDMQRDLQKIRFDSVISREINPGKKKNLRREIARVKTILREREIRREKEAKGEGK